jgi:hypothetical protein
MMLRRLIIVLVRVLARGRTELSLENPALRRQLAVLRRTVERPRIARRDRACWITLSRS